MSTQTKQRPVHEIRLGAVKATIWPNETVNGMRYSTSFSRLYKTDSGEWRQTESFGRDDLPLLTKVADQAHDWIFSNPA